MRSIAREVIVFEEVLRFWIVDTEPQMWWRADPHFDALVAERFGAALRAAEHSELYGWRVEPPGWRGHRPRSIS
jgi:uncharacterized protein (DUF924 family)